MPSITVTGVDRRTPLSGIQAILDAGAEVGFLWTETPEGRNRYPSLEWICDTVCDVHGGRTAVHACGRVAREYLLVDHASPGVLFDRIQVNGAVSVPELRGLCTRYPEQVVITQDNAANVPLREFAEARVHAILVDGSGGRGIVPARWQRPQTTKEVGFAGGLGPHNLEAELPKIAAIATGEWWIDMESGVRTDDWFDVNKALEAVRIFNRFAYRGLP